MEEVRFDPLPDGSYLCKTSAEWLDVWQERHLRLRMVVLAPDRFVGKNIQTTFPVTNRANGRLTMQFREVMNATGLTQIQATGQAKLLSDIPLGAVVVATIIRPLLRLSGDGKQRIVRIRPRSVWRETAAVAPRGLGIDGKWRDVVVEAASREIENSSFTRNAVITAEMRKAAEWSPDKARPLKPVAPETPQDEIDGDRFRQLERGKRDGQK